MGPDDVFKGKEINALLQAAARLQEEDLAKNSQGLGLSLAEVEEIAAESGIDPKYIRQAALITQSNDNDEDSFHIWGGPITVKRDFIVHRALSRDEMEDLVPSIQRITDKTGTTSSLKNSLTWTAHTGRNQGSMSVSMQVEGGKTVCNLKAPVMMPGFLIHYVPLMLAFLIGLPFAATRGFTPTILTIAAVLMSSLFLITRFAYSKYADMRKNQIDEIEKAIKAVGVSKVDTDQHATAVPVGEQLSSTDAGSASEAPKQSRSSLLDIEEDTGPNDGKAQQQRRMRE